MGKPSLFHSLSRVKAVFIGCLLLILLSGCSGDETAPQKGDFAFDLPEGYSVSDVTDESCSIVREQDGVAVGGIEATGLKRADLKKDEKPVNYLQNQFHQTNNIEFISMHWGDAHPMVTVNLTKHDDETGEASSYSHTFFEKGSVVYHMWFDHRVIDEDAAEQFHSIADVD